MPLLGGPTGLLTALLAKRLGASVLVLGTSRLFESLCEAEMLLILCNDR